MAEVPPGLSTNGCGNGVRNTSRLQPTSVTQPGTSSPGRPGRRFTIRPATVKNPRLIAAAALLLLALLATLGTARPAAAHAFLKTSNPPANAVVATAPPTAVLTFTEPLERASTWAKLYDQTGQQIPQATVRAGADDYTMVLELPAALPNGTYTILWHTLSTADGHTAEGYIPITVGTQADVRIVAPPAVGVESGPPDWLEAMARWTALLGLAAAVAVWPVWLFVLRPAISPAWQAGPALTRRVKRLAAGAIVFALLGSLFALLVQAAGFAGTGGFVDDLRATLLDTRYGRFWLIRIGLFLVYGALLTVAAWWFPKREKVLTLAGLLLAAALPIPFSLVAHAAAQPSGRVTAEAFDVAHLLAASLWVGGLFVLLGAFVPSLRDLTPAGRRIVLGRALPRFSALALASWAMLGVTGLYSAWLNVGNLEALRETAYGRSLTLKALLLVPLLALGAINLLIVGRGLNAAGRDHGRILSWSRRFAVVVSCEVALVVIVLLVVGRLTSQAPAREELALSAGRATIALKGDGRSATLIITPGATGPNHYRLEFGGDTLPADAQALLRLQLPAQGTGEVQIDLTRAAGNAFEWHGSELSIAGDWTIQAQLIRPGQADWTATKSVTIGTTPPAVDLPAPAWRFGTAGVLGLVLLALGAVGLAVGWQAGRAPLRRESIGLGMVATAVGLVLLLQARLEPAGATLGGAAVTNPIPRDDASVARGQELFMANCAACHGTGGRGDGPAAASLNPPPADLTSSHARLHLDQDLFFWVENGITGTGMPAFGDTLSDDQIWDILNYVRSLQDTALANRDAPGPENCTVAPRTIKSLEALADPSLAATPGGVTIDTAVSEGPVEIPTGQPADQQTVAEINAAVHELVACSNARDPLRRLALFTDDYLRPGFALGPTDAFTRSVATPAVPLPVQTRLAIVSITDVQVLADGRVRATLAVDNPTTHRHGPNGEELTGQQMIEVATFIYERVGDRWLIDELLDAPPVTPVPLATGTPGS
jgi:copper transport protein